MKRMNKTTLLFFALAIVTLGTTGFITRGDDKGKQETMFNYCNQVPNESLFHQTEWGR